MTFQHQTLSAGKWFEFSLAEQLGNIGSEIHRAIRTRGDKKRFEGATGRALELFDLTLRDPRWRKRLKEIARARELFCTAIYDDCAKYNTTLEDLNRGILPILLSPHAQTANSN